MNKPSERCNPACKAYLDKAEGNVRADQWRCHDQSVLHWLVHNHKFNMLFTCFATPTPGTPLASQHQTVPNNRAPLLAAVNIWEEYFKGKSTLRDLVGRYDGSICLVAPERSEFMPMFISKFQKDLMELHMATMLGVEQESWRVGILVNAPRFPLLYKEKTEDFWLGMHMVHMDFFHVGLWPFIDELQFFKPPKHMQVGVGYHAPKATQVCRYHGVLVFSGSNQLARDTVNAANKNTWLQNTQNVWMEKWGTLRMDLSFLEKKMTNSKKPMMGMVLKTWRWVHCPPPKITIWGPPLHDIDINLGWKFSLDFQMPQDRAEQWALEQSIKVAVQTLNNKWENKINLQHASRRGYAHQTWDPMQAWDITIANTDSLEASCTLMNQLCAELAAYSPMQGYHQTFSRFEDWPLPIVEFTHSDAILGLKKQGKVLWLYFVCSQMAIVDFVPRADTGEALEQALQACQAWNKQQSKYYKETGVQGSFIDRIVLSKAMMGATGIQSRMQDIKERVFWDRHSMFAAKEDKEAVDSRSIDALNDKEVVVTLYNFPYLANKQQTCDALVKVVHPLIFDVMQRHGGALVGQDLCLEWSATHLGHIFKIITKTALVANYLCTKVIDMNFILADTLASLNMKSSFHIVGQQDFKAYFGNYMIMDVTKDLNTVQQDALKKEEELHKARQEWQQKEQAAQAAQAAQQSAAQAAQPAHPAQPVHAPWSQPAEQATTSKQEEEELQAQKALNLRLQMENEELKLRLAAQADLDDAGSWTLPSEVQGVSSQYDAQA